MQQYFNPRSPHGERQVITMGPERRVVISIHAPRMGSDLRSDADGMEAIDISIHAPRMGSDN